MNNYSITNIFKKSFGNLCYKYPARSAVSQTLSLATCACYTPAMTSTKTIIFSLLALEFLLKFQENVAFAAMALRIDHRINITDNCIPIQSLMVHVRDFRPYTIVRRDGNTTSGMEIILIKTIAEKIGFNIKYQSSER